MTFFNVFNPFVCNDYFICLQLPKFFFKRLSIQMSKLM